jgi:hypothetical protein
MFRTDTTAGLIKSALHTFNTYAVHLRLQSYRKTLTLETCVHRSAIRYRTCILYSTIHTATEHSFQKIHFYNGA